MTRSRLLLFVLTLLLILPPGLFGGQDNVAPPLAVAPGMAAPQDAGTDAAGPTFEARKRGARKAKRRQARKAERAERREQRREHRKRGRNSEQARIMELVDDAPPRLPALAETDDPCGPGLIQMRKSGRCTHGPDDPPPAEVLANLPDDLASATASRLTADGACADDGQTGFRVQVLYVRSLSGSDNYAGSLADMRKYAAGANTILRDSAIAAANKEMNFSFVMTEDCQIDVDHVVMSPTAIRSFDASITALEQQGYDRVDRIYLMFADRCSAG